MGNLNAHPVGRLQQHYGLTNFVETGLGPTAVGLRTALRLPFEWLRSVEGLPSIALRAAEVVRTQAGPGRWEIVVEDSAVALPDIIAAMPPGPALWWLDAHYPRHYDGDGVVDTPLRAEVEAIVTSKRDHWSDVLLMDDWRIYGGAYGSGKLPLEAKGITAGDPADATAILEMLFPSHTVYLDQREGGYLVALPRRCERLELPATYGELCATSA